MIPQNLKDLEHFRSDPRVQFKEETVAGIEVVIPCYMIANAEFWDIPFARELRGHTYRKDTGELIGAAFHKFFNVGEREETQSNQIDWDNCYPHTFNKMDGSMINAVVIPYEYHDTHGGMCEGKKVFFKTKKSFYSDVAKDFTEWFWKQEGADDWVEDIIKLSENGFSPIFEFFHPDWQIVLNYGSEPEMWHLNTRKLDDGSYWDGLNPPVFNGMNKPEIEYWENLSDLAYAKANITGIEGWIVFDFKKQEFYKVKTNWYLQQHKVRTQMRERDVAELAAREQLDDVKSVVSDAGLDLSKIEWIEKSVMTDIISIRIIVESCAEHPMQQAKFGIEIGAKEMANTFKEHPYFGLIMTKFRGKEPNYVEYFLRNILKEKYTLKNVYNKKF